MTTPNLQNERIPSTPPIIFDEDGFLVDPFSWTYEMAGKIAELDGIGDLSKDHWAIISYLRDYYFNFGALPLMRRVCRTTNLHHDAVKQLFGGCRSVWRVAGLPNPGEEAKAYMS